MFAHLSSTKTCPGGAEAQHQSPPLSLCCHSKSPLGCLPEKGGEKEKERKRGNGAGEGGVKREQRGLSPGLWFGSRQRCEVAPHSHTLHRPPNVQLCASLHPHIAHHLGGPVWPNSHKGNIGMQIPSIALNRTDWIRIFSFLLNLALWFPMAQREGWVQIGEEQLLKTGRPHNILQL